MECRYPSESSYHPKGWWSQVKTFCLLQIRNLEDVPHRVEMQAGLWEKKIVELVWEALEPVLVTKDIWGKIVASGAIPKTNV